MAVIKSKLEIYLQEEIKKYRGICMPVKAGMLERMFVKHLACTAMHPNPADEYGKTDKRIRYKGGQR